MSEKVRVTGRLIYKYGCVANERNPDPVQHAEIELDPLTDEQRRKLKKDDWVLVKLKINNPDGLSGCDKPICKRHIVAILPKEERQKCPKCGHISLLTQTYKNGGSGCKCLHSKCGYTWNWIEEVSPSKYDPDLRPPARILGHTIDEIREIIDYAKQYGYERKE